MKLEIETFKTVDGGETISIRPSSSRRQKSNWYVWVKENGEGLAVVDSEAKRLFLPANSDRKPCNGDHKLDDDLVCGRCGKQFRKIK